MRATPDKRRVTPSPTTMPITMRMCGKASAPAASVDWTAIGQSLSRSVAQQEDFCGSVPGELFWRPRLSWKVHIVQYFGHRVRTGDWKLRLRQASLIDGVLPGKAVFALQL